MPTIRLPQGRATIQDQVPGADLQVRSQGDLGNAYADFGRTVENIGAQLLDSHVKAQAIDYGYSKETEDKVAIKQYGDNLKLNTKLGTDEYSTKMEEFVKQRSEINQQNAPTERARLSYLGKSEALHSNTMIEAKSYENKRNAESYIKNIDAGIDLNQRLFLDAPDPTKYKETVDGIHQQISAQEGTQLLSPEMANALRAKASQQLSSSILQGLAIQEKYDAGIKLLDSKNGESDVAQGLTGEQKASFLKQFQQLKQVKTETSMKLINENIKDFQYAAISGGKVDQVQLSKILSGVASNNAIKPEDKQRIADTLKTVVQASGEMQNLNKMTTEELINYQPKIDTKNTFNVAARAEIANHIDAYRQQLIKKRADDPLAQAQTLSPQLKSLATQAQGGDPNVSKQYLEQGLAAQKQMGVASPRVTTKQESVFNSQQLLAAPSASAADVVLQNFKLKYGEYLPKALDEMAKDKSGVTHDYVIAAYLPNQQQRISAIENIKNQKDINVNYSTTFKNVKPDIDTPFNKISLDLRKSIIQRTSSSDDLGVYNAFAKQIGLETKKQLAINPEMKPEKAVNAAYENIVTKNFEMIPSARSTIMMPKQVDGSFNDPKNVENFITLNSGSDSFKKMEVAVPPNFQNADDWYNKLETKSRWVTNGSLTGIQLVFDSERTGKVIPVLDKQHRPIEKSFKEIMLINPASQQQDLKSAYKKIELGAPNGKL